MRFLEFCCHTLSNIIVSCPLSIRRPTSKLLTLKNIRLQSGLINNGVQNFVMQLDTSLYSSYIFSQIPHKMGHETSKLQFSCFEGGQKKKKRKIIECFDKVFSRLSWCLVQCAEMLDCLGVPWVTGAGEAEAMCAFLDLHGFVDGCITNDGDAFLYGAQTVYRNFNMNTKVRIALVCSF